MIEPNREDPGDGIDLPEESERDHKSRNVVWIVAGGCLLVGVLNLAAYWLKSHNNHEPITPLGLIFRSIPLVAGLALLIKSRALAERIEEFLDD